MDETARRMRAARHVLVLTGAGVSAESGIPTFRDALTGLWSKYRAEDLATPEAFARDPGTVWRWYAERRARIGEAQPNPAHRTIARLEKLVPRLTLATQNVDGLHQRAGSRNVHELHGNIMRTICSNERRVVESWLEPVEPPPRCPNCEAPLRPDVIWFGELLPQHAFEAAASAAESCDLVLVVGTSGLVYPAAAIPQIALSAGVPVALVDLNPVPLAARADVQMLQGPAGQVLPRLLVQAWPSEAS